MSWYRQLLWVLSFILYSCTLHPYSKWQIKEWDDDLLSTKEKVQLVSLNETIKSASSWVAISRYYAQEENWNNALSAINQAIKLDPLNSNLHGLKANYAFNAGNISIAYSEAITAYKLGAKSLRQSLGLAKIAVALSEFEMAGDIIDSLLLVYPDKPEVLYLAARKYDMNAELTKARVCYQKVASLEPTNQENAFYYGRFLLSQKEPVNARFILARAAAGGNSMQYRQLQGDTYYFTSQYDSAAWLYHQALAYRADTVIFNKLIKVYKKLDYSDSLISIACQAADLYPSNKRYLLLSARSLDHGRQHQQALMYYQQLYELDTLDSMVVAEMSYLQRKIAYLQRKEREQKKLTDSLSKALPVITF